MVQVFGGTELFYFERKIYYIDLYEKEERKGNAGFITITTKENACHVHIGIRGIGQKKSVKCSWYGLLGEQKVLLEEFYTRDGQADFEKDYPMPINRKDALVNDGKIIDKSQGEKNIDVVMNDWKGFYFQFGKNAWGNCFAKKDGDSQIIVVQEKTKRVPRGTFEELLQNYPVVQPFRNQGDYVEIEPMTLKVLAPGYRKLADNSFLLHGYYTHKHIILGFYQDSERAGYYLGVPGTFESKDQLMAEMFGFEGYERSGDMGYYMRRVEF